MTDEINQSERAGSRWWEPVWEPGDVRWDDERNRARPEPVVEAGSRAPGREPGGGMKDEIKQLVLGAACWSQEPEVGDGRNKWHACPGSCTRQGRILHVSGEC